MVRLVIVIATVSVIVIAGLIIYKIGPPGSIGTTGNGGPNTTSGPGPPTGPKEPSVHHTVSINAVPWAEVLIKSPETNEEISYGYTPITVDVPIEAKVILRYNNEEQAFSYKLWKDEKRISHDFLSQ